MCEKCEQFESAFAQALLLPAWVESVYISTNDELRSMDLIIEHSYPPGVSVAPYIKGVIRDMVRSNINVEVTYQKVKPGHGLIVAAEQERRQRLLQGRCG